MFIEHTGIIPRDDLGNIGSFTYAPTEKNVQVLHTCESRMLGVECKTPGKPCTVGESTHILCDFHHRFVLRLIRAWFETRKHTQVALLEDLLRELEASA